LSDKSASPSSERPDEPSELATKKPKKKSPDEGQMCVGGLCFPIGQPPTPESEESREGDWVSDDRDALIARIYELRENEGTNEEILEKLDELIVIDGEEFGLLEYRFYLLGELGRHDEALALAEKMAADASRESPWNRLRLAKGLIPLRRKDEAYGHLEFAIRDQRFRRVKEFEASAYDPIREEKRFAALVAESEGNIGLGEEAKDFSLTLLEGEQIRLSDFRGSLVLIDFWSIDCPPCVNEIPTLRKLHKEFGEDGLVILGINMNGDPERVKTFVKEEDMAWPISCSGKAWQDDAVLLYGVQAMPSIWLIDENGAIQAFDLRGEKLEEAVRSMLRT